jgi:hypothetical protein
MQDILAELRRQTWMLTTLLVLNFLTLVLGNRNDVRNEFRRRGSSGDGPASMEK